MKISSLFFLPPVFCLSFLWANGSNIQNQSLEERVTALENRPITPPVGSCAKQGIGMYMFGGPIFARASADGLDYAIIGDYNYNAPDSESFTLDLTAGKAHTPKFHWGWGFVVGLGGYLPHDGWDLSSQWKRFHGKASGHLSTDSDPDPNNVAIAANFGAASGTGTYISPFWVAKLFDVPRLVNRAAAHWHYRFDVWDLDLGREFLVSKFLSLKPYVGARTAWLDQNYNLKFLALNFTAGIAAEPGEIARKIGIRMKNDLWGIGGKLGLNTKWMLGKGFCLYSTSAFSVLDGWYSMRYKLADQKPIRNLTQAILAIGVSTDPYESDFIVKKHLHTVVTIADLGIGFCWEKPFCQDRVCLTLKLGYDYSVFFGTSKFLNPQYDFTLIAVPTFPLSGSEGPNFFIDGGNTTLSGLSASASLAF